MDPKIFAVAAIIVGVVLVFKDQLLALLVAAPKAAQSVQSSLPKFTANSNSLMDLEDLVKSLDSEKDKEELDYLIDRLAPKLIRRKLGR